MKKILLAALNAKYIHSNLAVYSLKAYAGEYGEQVEIAEYTINHKLDDMLRDIYSRRPDVLCLSCYIWNINQICSLIGAFHKVMPKVPIWLGGPEVSFESEDFLERYQMVKGLMLGEGEATFRELCASYIEEKTELSNIPGLLYRTAEGALIQTGRRLLLHMDELPFCYEQLEEFENRILYYETSRGCPFCCSYCLSSLEKSLRFRKLDLVYRELAFFLEHRVPQVKLVDRTFNCNHGHAMAVWRFLKENDNGITNFHFEVSADLFTGEELELLSTMRPGLVQLEIGVQTTNERTVSEIHRTMNLNKLEAAVKRVGACRNIHQHLDLIAGLPFEDFNSFQNSFNHIFGMHPQQLQLGFLKVLKGSYLYEHREEYDLIYHDEPPYEVLTTKWLSYQELLKIKLVEEMLEVYYNSGQFEMTMQAIALSFESPFHFFMELGEFYGRNGYRSVSHSRLSRCGILRDFLEEKDREHLEFYSEALTFDLYLREKMKSRPKWAPDPAGFREQTRRYCPKGSRCHLEPFYYDFSNLLNHNLTNWPLKNDAWRFYLFDYEKRDPLTNQAKAVLCLPETEPEVKYEKKGYHQ